MIVIRSQRLIDEPEIIEEYSDNDIDEPVLKEWGERRHLSVDSDEDRLVCCHGNKTIIIVICIVTKAQTKMMR